MAEPVVGFRVTAYNWRLRRAREAAGLSQREVAELAGLALGTVQQVETLAMRGAPETLARIAAAVGCEAVEIFPDILDELPRGIRAIDIPILERDARALLDRPQPLALAERALDLADLRGDLEACLGEMSPREATVIRLRFGLDGQPMTLGEIADRLGITGERVRQMEAEGLRRLRRGSLGKMLRPHADHGLLWPQQCPEPDGSTGRFRGG